MELVSLSSSSSSRKVVGQAERGLFLRNRKPPSSVAVAVTVARTSWRGVRGGDRRMRSRVASNSERESGESGKKRCLRCNSLYHPLHNSPSSCSFHAHITGEKGLFALAPPHQGIDGEWTDRSGVIVYKWNDKDNRPNTGIANWKKRWSCCSEYDENAPPCRRGWHVSYDDGFTMYQLLDKILPCNTILSYYYVRMSFTVLSNVQILLSSSSLLVMNTVLGNSSSSSAMKPFLSSYQPVEMLPLASTSSSFKAAAQHTVHLSI